MNAIALKALGLMFIALIGLIHTMQTPLIFSGLRGFASKSPKTGHSAVITREFSRNKKIWGTYQQLHEVITPVKGKKLKRPVPALSELVIKKGRFHFVGPESEGIYTRFNIESFPYTRKKAHYILDTGEFKTSLFEKYKNALEAIEKRPLVLSDVDFGDIICKKRRGGFKCHLPVKFKE